MYKLPRIKEAVKVVSYAIWLTAVLIGLYFTCEFAYNLIEAMRSGGR